MNRILFAALALFLLTDFQAKAQETLEFEYDFQPLLSGKNAKNILQVKDKKTNKWLTKTSKGPRLHGLVKNLSETRDSLF